MKKLVVSGWWLVAGAITAPAVAAVMPLEWNVNNPVETPYEVELSPAKLEKLAGIPKDSGFVVKADGKALNTTVLPGKALDTVDLRFKVPAGTKKLECETVNRREGAPETFAACPHAATVAPETLEVDNLFAGALGDPKAWKIAGGQKKVAITKLPEGGLRFANSGDTATVKYTAAVPKELCGKPVKLALDCTSRTPMTWGGRIAIAQYDAQGKLLPESLSDPRWTSHMRPQNYLANYRERGRIHPEAAKLEISIELRYREVRIDNYGMPLEDKSALAPILDVTRLAVRPAAELPFPKFRDELFPAGVSGAEGDCAITLGGEKAFWYQTCSQASWAEAKQLREESQRFFPSAAGTIEAYFKPSKFGSGITYLFEANNHGAKTATSVKGKASHNNETLGTIVGVDYVAARKMIRIELLDYAKKKFKGEAKWEMPVGKWTHLALCWKPDGEAVLYADGHRILSVPLKGYVPYDLKDAQLPNSFGAVEVYLGSCWKSARAAEVKLERFPFFEGEADAFRVSTGVRYAADFTPAKSFVCDADTRALFNFDRSFDGISGGGIRWINGTWRDFVDRVDHELEVKGQQRKVQYYPAEIAPEMDPTKVLDINNYPKVCGDAEFAESRVFKSSSSTMKAGDVMKVKAPKGVYTEFVEFANTSDQVLKFPALVRKGEIDPRSFGDIADSLVAKEQLSDRDRANRVFQFVINASDYFMNHMATFDPGSDTPRSVEYEALIMLNAYCGFECGPLNNLAANMLACAGKCPSSQTAGYGHSFEEVFYEGKNHIYDLSAQQFFTAMDNESAAYLEEDAQQPGCHYRIGKSSDHFIRSGTRSHNVQSPAFQRKVAMSLNPGERLRMWFMNDGGCNDLQINSCFCGNRRLSPSRNIKPEDIVPYQENYEERTGAKLDKSKLVGGVPPAYTRVNRFFPHYSNGFVIFDGKPNAANPAFVNASGSSFCYKVDSIYPIVSATYSARKADGSPVALELCTDWKEYRPLELDSEGVAHLDYKVRARMSYWIRVKAPIAEVAQFKASTEVMANSRIFPGKLVAGENEMLFKACSENAVKVTLGWSEPSKPIEFVGALKSGTIPGMERHLVVMDPKAGKKTVEVRGISGAAKVEASAGIDAKLADGKLTIAAKAAKESVEFLSVKDGDSVKELTVIVARGAKLLLPSDAELSGSAYLSQAGQPSVALTKEGDQASFKVSGIGDGDWSLWSLTRWESHSKTHRERPLAAKGDKFQAIGAAGPINHAMQFHKAHYGQPGERSQWKWDFVIAPKSYYPYQQIERMKLGGSKQIDLALRQNLEKEAELAAVLLLPYPEEEFRCQLIKTLGGLNYAPWRMR